MKMSLEVCTSGLKCFWQQVVPVAKYQEDIKFKTIGPATSVFT